MSAKDKTKELIGLMLKQFRQSLGKTQRQVAEELGVSRGLIAHHERGRSLVTQKHLIMYDQIYFDVSDKMEDLGEVSEEAEFTH